MRRYETIAIVDPDLNEDGRTSLFNRIKEIIPQEKGVLIHEDLWGAKKLAYAIKNKPRGFYVRYDYCGMGPVVDELERFFRIDDRVLKYLTAQLAENVDADKILAEIAAEKSGDEPKAKSTDDKPSSQPEPQEPAEQPSSSDETTTAAITEPQEKE